MLRQNMTKSKLKAGQPVIGMRMEFSSPYLVHSLGNLGLDFVYFDLEHGLIGEESCQEMLRAAEAANLTPLVRVPLNETGTITRVLDAGAMGIIASHCKSKEDAESAVKAVKLPPEGERGTTGPPGGMTLSEYITAVNRETLVIVMIEESEALDNLSSILAVAELDVLFIGRLDLSLSLGIPGQVDNPRIQQAVERVITEGKAAGKAVGVGAINVGDPGSIREFIKRGAQFFSLNAVSLLRNSTASLLNEIKLDWSNSPGRGVR
jgi:4-hydroxy-2-oxoheptanedioate aldolase